LEDIEPAEQPGHRPLRPGRQRRHRLRQRLDRRGDGGGAVEVGQHGGRRAFLRQGNADGAQQRLSPGGRRRQHIADARDPDGRIGGQRRDQGGDAVQRLSGAAIGTDIAGTILHLHRHRGGIAGDAKGDAGPGLARLARADADARRIGRAGEGAAGMARGGAQRHAVAARARVGGGDRDQRVIARHQPAARRLRRAVGEAHHIRVMRRQVGQQIRVDGDHQRAVVVDGGEEVAFLVGVEHQSVEAFLRRAAQRDLQREAADGDAILRHGAHHPGPELIAPGAGGAGAQHGDILVLVILQDELGRGAGARVDGGDEDLGDAIGDGVEQFGEAEAGGGAEAFKQLGAGGDAG
jgi:hypothetical protein